MHRTSASGAVISGTATSVIANGMTGGAIGFASEIATSCA